MKRLDRKNYNQIVAKLNSKTVSQNEAIKLLLAEYKKPLCHFPDYEELVLLINLCIAEDRENKYDDLYPRYKRVDNILSGHSGFGLYQAYKLFYCVGVFSFKFHDYSKARYYFEKCITDINRQTNDPLNNNSFRDFYIQSKILISYALEYGKKPGGAYKAIENIIKNGKISNNTMQIADVFSSSSAEVVGCFFQYNKSDIYEAANEKMQNEIIHMLAHCFSEHAVFLKSQKPEMPRSAYIWELLSEKFIEYLGSNMVTCTATILAEHGHYPHALDLLWERYNALACSADNREKAEVSFYIYYFSNRIGLDNDRTQKCKDEFLKYAADSKNKDTELYAWITNFRARFGQIVDKLSIETITEMETLFNDEEDNTNVHSYVHPQIEQEKRRLQLAYQIIRSYTLINKNAIEQADNSLFEKCILFNALNQSNASKKKASESEYIWHPDQDSLVFFYGLSLCVYGFSQKICEQLSLHFNTEIYPAKKNMMGNQKIIICSSEEQIPSLITIAAGQGLTCFVYCEDSELNKKFRRAIGNSENFNFSATLENVFKIAYIQETIERCHVCAHRWNEYFIMAPITDNSTFAFQSQVIDQYLEMGIDSEEEKNIFSNKNGYATNDFIEPRSVREIHCPVLLSQSADDLSCRIFFYIDSWVYRYDQTKELFIPETFSENKENINEQVKSLDTRSKRNALRKEKCNCHLKLDICVCVQHSLSLVPKSKEQVENLLITLSLGLIKASEDTYTLLFPESSQNDYHDSFMLILSNKPVRNCVLRQSFDNLISLYRNLYKHSSTGFADAKDTTESDGAEDSNNEEDNWLNEFQSAKKRLIHKIQQYQKDRMGRLSSFDTNKISELLKKAKNCDHIEECDDIDREWESLMTGR